ncbi:hypothetical protein C8Q72DRAFT_631342 [Fomitopsis betulina]|nr:hypothetical protein C8Q72DRAFT_631342 [Fomitopsis betulina]
MHRSLTLVRTALWFQTGSTHLVHGYRGTSNSESRSTSSLQCRQLTATLWPQPITSCGHSHRRRLRCTSPSVCLQIVHHLLCCECFSCHRCCYEVPKKTGSELTQQCRMTQGVLCRWHSEIDPRAQWTPGWSTSRHRAQEDGHKSHTLTLRRC